MGATGGGVWKTTDEGNTWNNISDGYFNTTGIGDITVAPSNPNIIYVGTEESPVRGVKTSLLSFYIICAILNKQIIHNQTLIN